MRILHTNIQRPKRAAKLISRIAEVPLSKCQQAVAKGTGYNGWHELERSILTENISTSCNNLERQADILLSIANYLNIRLAPVQYAIILSRLINPQPPSLKNQLQVMALAFRKSSIPYLGRGKRGEVGRDKAESSKNTPLILKSALDVVRGLTNHSPNALRGHHEYESPTREEAFIIPHRLYFAYGQWHEADGSTVVFSRDYCPMWRLRDGHAPEPINPSIRIDYIKQTWFWGDAKGPYRDNPSYEDEIKLLKTLGIKGPPNLVDVLPTLVNQDAINDVGDAVRFCFS